MSKKTLFSLVILAVGILPTWPYSLHWTFLPFFLVGLLGLTLFFATWVRSAAQDREPPRRQDSEVAGSEGGGAPNLPDSSAVRREHAS